MYKFSFHLRLAIQYWKSLKFQNDRNFNLQTNYYINIQNKQPVTEIKSLKLRYDPATNMYIHYIFNFTVTPAKKNTHHFQSTNSEKDLSKSYWN